MADEKQLKKISAKTVGDLWKNINNQKPVLHPLPDGKAYVPLSEWIREYNKAFINTEYYQKWAQEQKLESYLKESREVEIDKLDVDYQKIVVAESKALFSPKAVVQSTRELYLIKRLTQETGNMNVALQGNIFVASSYKLSSYFIDTINKSLEKFKIYVVSEECEFPIKISCL